MQRRNRMGSAIMPIDLARTPTFNARIFLAPFLAALLALGFGRGASAQTHDLMEGRGRDVSLPVSCGADIQPRFDAALAALHSFWYGQALKEFTVITEAKPDCAMAYWGIAMSVWNQIWARPNKAFEAFEASLRTSKNRLRRYAGAAAAAAAMGNAAGARSYYTKLVELADGGTRPEIVEARAYLQQANR